ncbi:MAG: hypothetical protein H6577_10315 [Lewinellaceae bacterium]|nr:hypothetical protein [Saprospiraceae bacterium]MCB9338510.1 hypothetical protein [Lewinellaceae bacterium]
MKKSTTVFITYNPDSEAEQRLAVRLHSIGAVNGFRMFLPERYFSETVLDNETKRRIEDSDYYVVFSLGKLSQIVQQEIEYAFNHLRDKSRIIVIYDAKKGENLSGQMTNLFHPFDFDPVKDSVDDLVAQVLTHIAQQQAKKQETDKAFATLLGIGLGLWALSSLSESRK